MRGGCRIREKAITLFFYSYSHFDDADRGLGVRT
jgi:hypothetical protein